VVEKTTKLLIIIAICWQIRCSCAPALCLYPKQEPRHLGTPYKEFIDYEDQYKRQEIEGDKLSEYSHTPLDDEVTKDGYQD